MQYHVRTALAMVLYFCTSSAFAKVFLVVSNSSSFTAFESSEASFAPHVAASDVKGLITLSVPLDACSPLNESTSTQSSTSLFLLIVRGNCSFEEKVRHAQAAKFSAVIIYNNESGTDLLKMSGDSKGVFAYAFFVTHESGEALARYADDSSTEVWVISDNENIVFSVVVFSLIILVIIGAVIVTWYLLKKDREIRLGGRFSRSCRPGVMNPSIVQAMPVTCYRAYGNEKAPQESCVICLEEYLNGEQLRILPCSHRFHCTCVDAWLTLWQDVCPICRRDAHHEFPDLQISEKTPLLNFTLSGVRGLYGTKEASSSESLPIVIPHSYLNSQMDCLDIPSSSKGMDLSCSRVRPPLAADMALLRTSAIDISLEAFRASPFFTPPSLSHNTSPLQSGPAIMRYPLDCPLADGSISSHLSGPGNTRKKSYLNPNKRVCASPTGAFSPQ
ncbi:hypothetical protein KP509_01G078100 [Ceratopteris richardii]|uniref:RING-type E3 ubiquitin transferase n=1 Tax=Ceratopteris richardii TaxID=49495 RepID=A0A8T2VM46_CERRI|nr:hypothetical protein KP509_01G078100 [Ceratopteris richardii]